jgi:hypothetical protein
VTPAADLVTDHAAIVVQDRPVVPLSSWIADAIRQCGGDGRVLQIVTSSDARITAALRTAMRSEPAQWVARDDGGYYDGLSGVRLMWDGGRFVSDLDDEGKATVAEPFTQASDGLRAQLALTLLVRHPMPERMTLGLAAERLTAALTGSPPTGWGATEPLTRPWDRSELTAACRERGSRPTFVVFNGGSGTDAGRAGCGALSVAPRHTDVEETVEMIVVYPPHDDLPLDDLGSLVEIATSGTAFETMVVFRHAGPTDLTVPARWTGFRAPVGLAVGPEQLRGIGRGQALSAPDVRPRIIGGVQPSVWFPLGDGRSVEGFQRLHRLLQHLGGDSYLRGLGL